MSTRCQIQFYDRELPSTEPTARIYQHADGYPDSPTGIIVRLRQLYRRLSLKDPALKKMPHPFAKLGMADYVDKTMHDYSLMFGTRIGDAEWAAAEFITMFRKPMGGNIFVTSSLHGDESYLYHVDMTVNPWQVSVYTSTETDWELEKVVSIPAKRKIKTKTSRNGRKFR